MTLGLVVPSAASLALPIVVFLAVTLRALPPPAAGEQQAPADVVIRR